MRLFSFMWAYGLHFRTKNDDDGHLTHDCGIEVEFDQSSRASHRDRNLIGEMFGYVRKI